MPNAHLEAFRMCFDLVLPLHNCNRRSICFHISGEIRQRRQSLTRLQGWDIGDQKREELASGWSCPFCKNAIKKEQNKQEEGAIPPFHPGRASAML